jgi:high affinity Mn2+ porin
MIRTLLIAFLVCVAPGVAHSQQHASIVPQQSSALTQTAQDGAAVTIPEGNQPAQQQTQTGESGSPAMFSSHLIADRFWLSGQANLIFQAHGPFHSPYQGTNSFIGTGETANSRVFTLYTALKLRHSTDLIFDLEEISGGGLSQALGLAGFTNLDVVRNPTLGPGVYMARIMLHQTFPLTADRVEVDPKPLNVQGSVPTRRIELRVGKMSVVDFFDVNAIGSDSHLQFTNWAIANNGAYDYAADTRGYTYAAILEYQSPRFGVRFGEALMPAVANGIAMEWDPTVARAENVELEFRPQWLQGLPTCIRPLAYLNHANMGSFAEAISAWKAGADPTPDVTHHRHQGTLKQGFGLNIEQALPANLRAYFRAGWNEGHHESFAYTEINNSVSFGLDLAGDQWRRKHDKVGSAFVTSGLSGDHRTYLADGGLGFLLGDGRLSYGREDISETYYNAHIWRGLYAAAQLTYIVNPGYNRTRGPAVIPGLRAHVDF